MELPVIGRNKDSNLSMMYTTWGHAKLLQHTDVLHGIQHFKEFSPIQIQLCPTELCESDCPFCSVGKRPYHSTMSWDTLTQCLRDFASLGAKSVEITGGGNPLLYKSGDKDINDIVEFANSICGMDVGIITNSHSLAKIDSTVHRRIQWIRISLIKLDEGKNPEDYNLAGFPEEKVGFSYIFYDKGNGPRTGREYEASDERTLDKISQVVDRFPKCKFVRLSGNCLVSKAQIEAKQKWSNLIENKSNFFLKDIGGNDRPYPHHCSIGMLRPYVAPSPNGDGRYLVYACTSHVLFSGQNYHEDYSLCQVEDILEVWKSMNDHFSEEGYPYEIKGNGGKEWDKTCHLCYFSPNNQLLHMVASEIPDKNFA